MVATEAAQLCFSTDSNPADGADGSPQNVNEAQRHSPPSTLSEPQHDETALAPSTTIAIERFISDVHSSEWLVETSQSPESWSNDSNLFSADSEVVSTMDSLEDSLSTDMLSVSDSSQEIELLNRSEETYPILSMVIDQLLSEFRDSENYQFASGECQRDSGGGEDRGEQTGSASSTAQSSSNGNTSTGSQKRKLLSKDNNGNSGDGNLSPPPKRHNAGQEKDLQRTLACPYLKKDPLKHTSCCSKKLTRIRDVKQHLTRAHYSELYCQSCQANNFRDDESLQRHIRVAKCSYRDPSTSDRMSNHQRGQLTRKSKGNTSVEDQWFAIWGIIFGQHPRPSSIYLDANLTRQMLQFRAYCCLRGPTLLREHIESNSSWIQPETAEEQQQTCLERVILQGINILFENWHSSDSSDSESPVSGFVNHQQQGIETPTSTTVETGMEIGSLASSGESRTRRIELPIAFESSSASLASQLSQVNRHAPISWTEQGELIASSHTELQSHPLIPFGLLEESTNKNEEDHNHGGDTGFHDAIDFNFDVEGLAGIAEVLGYSSEPFPFAVDNVNEAPPWIPGNPDDHDGTDFYPELKRSL